MKILLILSLAVVAVIAERANYYPATQDGVGGQYIVVMKPNGDNPGIAQIFGNTNNSLSHQLQIGEFRAYAGRLCAESLEAILNSENVSYVAQDRMAYIFGDDDRNDDDDDHGDRDHQKPCTCQTCATWGIDRIDHHELTGAIDGIYQYDSNGQSVDAYIIDTGIFTQHSEFEGRAIWGATFPSTLPSVDCNGHGTHVAGTVGGKTFGVAKKVTLIAVKVLGCDGRGSFSDVIAGVNWVTSRALTTRKLSVANMSLGGGFFQALNDAVAASIKAGVVYSVAAGNDGKDACIFSPASTPSAITVAASDINDNRAFFSNFGTCVDIFAPGVDITSAWIGSTTMTNTISGTSMATPHVCGAAALYREKNPTASPSQIANIILNESTKNAINLGCSTATNPTLCGVTPNKFLFSSCSCEDGCHR